MAVEDAQPDLYEAIFLMALFRQADLTSAIEGDATAVHSSVGLIPRGACCALTRPIGSDKTQTSG